jgi:hypothetical protein
MGGTLKKPANPIRVRLTKPQTEFLKKTCRHPLFVAGFGAGKTETMCVAAIGDAAHSSEALIGMYAPTYDLIRLITAPRLCAKLAELGVPHKHNKSENIVYTSYPRFGDFILRTMDNPARIVGFETYRSHVDEIDTMKEAPARAAWNAIIARNRQKPAGIMKPENRVSAYTTPEGFRFVYDRWVRNGVEGYEIVQAPTTSNPFLPDGYVDNLRASYPPELIDAYLEGRFVNLTSGTVYRNYDREKHRSAEVIRDNEPLYIGQDFNVNNMTSVIFVKRGDAYHAVSELTGIVDTPELIATLKEKFPGHAITIYPDASGDSRKTVNASTSDIALLRKAGFMVRVDAANPRVRDRILAMNGAYSKGLLYVNDTEAPTFAEAQEQQAYDKNGEPDKTSGHDHPNDAGGYAIVKLLPVIRPSFGVEELRV